MADEVFFDASYGDLPLLVADWDTAEGRDIVVQSPTRGDVHKLSDRGLKHVAARIVVLFCEEPGKAPYTQRFDAFRTLVKFGAPQIFSHELLGSYRARISDFDHKLNNAERLITVNCTVLAETEPELVFPTGAGVSSSAGLESVTDAAEGATALFAASTGLTALALSDPTPAACVAAVTAWSAAPSGTLDSAQVYADVATLTAKLQTAIDTYDLATDLDNWAAYRAYVLLMFELRRAGEAFTSAVKRYVNITIVVPQPLRALAAKVYGASLSDDMTQAITKLNRIRTPGLVPRGTYKIPAEGASP